MNSEHTPHTPTAAPVPAPMLVERDAAAYVLMSRAYLRQARMHGYGPPYVRFGRAIRYRVGDLDAWVDAHRISPRVA